VSQRALELADACLNLTLRLAGGVQRGVFTDVAIGARGLQLGGQ
jgi:hypothetical protein